MTPERVFQVLLGCGLAFGGWLYGDYWKKAEREREGGGDAAALRAQNADLVQEIDRLGEELAQVRSMLANGPYPVPDELMAWVEKEHNMVFLKTPAVRIASQAELREAAHRNLRRVHGEETLQREGRVWELLGLLPPSQHLPTQLLFAKSVGIKGLLDLTEGRILLAQDFDPLSVPDRSVLVRLLGQQLSLQNHPQEKWFGRDEWQAWQAIHVGAGAALQERFRERKQIGAEAEWSNPEPQREAILNDLAPVLQGFLNFPYLEGANFTRLVYRDSRANWSAMFQVPPKTTHRIVHPDGDPRAIPGLVPPEGPGELLLESDLGALGLRLWLESFIGMDQADRFSSHWNGDRYHLRQAGPSQSLVWLIRLSRAEVAEELATAVERSIFPVLREQQPLRRLSLDRAGSQLTLKNAPARE